tara:strand:+ start:42 stop:476 length:435 start_codon:yes stop_codon:yes gene_type:complete
MDKNKIKTRKPVVKRKPPKFEDLDIRTQRRLKQRGRMKKPENKTIEDLKNKTKAKYAALKESANSNNPMRTDRVFRTGNVNYRNPDGAIEFYGDKGSKKGLAEKAMNARLDRIDENPEMFKNFKGGGKVKLALKGGGRAYGNNS